MARETVHSPRPVSEFFNDARPWHEGGVVFVLMRTQVVLTWVGQMQLLSAVSCREKITARAPHGGLR